MMLANRPCPALALLDGDRGGLERRTRSSTVPASVAKRARIVLLAADGVANARIAVFTDSSANTVLAWRAARLTCMWVESEPETAHAGVTAF